MNSTPMNNTLRAMAAEAASGKGSATSGRGAPAQSADAGQSLRSDGGIDLSLPSPQGCN